MIQIIILLLVCLVFVFYNRKLDSKKSGCYYAASENRKPLLLEKEMKNLHRIQTPLWYCQFLPAMILLYIIFTLLHKDTFTSITASILMSMGTSAACGYFY